MNPKMTENLILSKYRNVHTPRSVCFVILGLLALTLGNSARGEENAPAANTEMAAAASLPQPTLPKAPYVSIQTVKEWQAKGERITFVDVREANEFEAGHLDGAINIPYLTIEKRALEIASDHPYVFYCIHSSWRAPYCANVMADLGYKNVYILEGGIAAWNAGGQMIYTDTTDQPPSVAAYPQELPKILKHPADQSPPQQAALTIEELRQYNGQNGRPAYVAVNGIIYDITQSRLWRGGAHDPSHGKVEAGHDLTAAIAESPHGDKHLKNFPVVGRVRD